LPTILSFLSGRQITNDSGVPQSGAKLYHYRENTTTALTVWQDDGASVAHAQPVVCDAGGFVPLIYIDDTFDWKVVIKTAAEVTLKTYDNLPKAETDESALGFAPPLFEWTQVTSGASPVALTVADVGKAFEADTTGGNVEFDLPSAASVGNGKGFVFKKPVAANSLILDPSGSETIDNSATSHSLGRINEALGIFSNGAEWYKAFGHFNNNVTMQVFTSSGTYTPSTGMHKCIVFSTGGGGGGGGADSDDGSNDTTAGGGGGAGGTCIEIFNATDIGASQTVTIGAAGTAGAAAAGTGGTGGTTTFGSLHSAAGGAGGVGADNTSTSNLGGGGAGGVATNGLINISGGGGGTGATSVGAVLGGLGGASFWGGGAQGGATAAANGAVAGIAASAYGSGGGGAANRSETDGAAGGAGAAGICVVLEFI
jgi:hypothetical protein